MHPKQNITQHKMHPKNESHVWSPPTISGLEMEQAYSERSR